MVNVTDGADVDVWFVPFELLASHDEKESGVDLEGEDQELP
ncbi:MAG: hypothetical protein WBM08_11995 [Prochlorococcaceae cyanobacterium]